jgi:hypothetical protein
MSPRRASAEEGRFRDVPGQVVQALNGAVSRLEDLSRDELIEMLEAQGEDGIRIDFSGKGNARKLARRVRPNDRRRVYNEVREALSR